jgi:hypothetical protein
MAFPTIRQSKAYPLSTAAAFVSGAWQFPTNAGSRLLAFVGFEAGAVNGLNMSPQDTTWLSLTPDTIRRQASALDELVMTVYQIKSAASRSAAERFNWTATKYGVMLIVEVEGSDPAQDVDKTNNAKTGGLSLTIPAPGQPAAADGLAFAWIVNGNPSTDQASWSPDDTPGPGWTRLFDSANGSNGSDRMRSCLYYRTVVAGDSPTITANLDGAITRNIQGTIHIFSKVPAGGGGGGGLAAPTLTAKPVDGSTGNVTFNLSESGT